MKKSLLIVGAGGHGKVVLDIAESTNEYEKISFLDDSKKIGEKVLGYEVIGKIADGHEYISEYTHAIIAIGNNDVRAELSKKFINLGYILPVLVHKSSVISKYAKVGQGTVIMPNVIINADTTIGDFAIINTRSIIEHDCVIGDGSHLSYGVLLGSGVKLDKKCMIDMGIIVQRNMYISK